MKSILIFGTLGTGMVATLLLGPLSGLIITAILYLAGCNLLLARELKQVHTRLKSHQRAEISDNTTLSGHQEREALPS